jgi:3-phenylpropionate/trans-cinnamate dioxygenase ferredoxin reductase subunit
VNRRIVVVGAGHAAGQLAVSLRQQGFDGSIQVIGEEPQPPYQRPPLSKGFLAGETDAASLAFRRPGYYEKHAVELLLDTRVEAIDRAAKSIRLADGQTIGYDRLALTTGARVRRLAVPGVELAGIHYLRTIADVDAIQPAFRPGTRLVVVGGGYIGLEVAAVAIGLGLQVTVLEMAPRVLDRVTSPVVAQFFARIHGERGVAIRTGAAVSGFEGEGRVDRVLCADGSRIEADLVIVGIGVVPNQELAAAAGLTVDDGIVVDRHAVTSDSEIVAAGDCTRHPSAFATKRVRLESVQNAVDQAKTAAATLCGNDLPYDTVPWFWSDQYDLKLQIAGLSTGYDEVVLRGDPEQRSFAAFYFGDGRLLAVDAINRPPEYMWARRMLAERRTIDRAHLADPTVPLVELVID